MKPTALLLALLATPALADLPLVPTRTLDFTTREATWMAPDVSPDGRTILFDVLGDIYALGAQGGAARPLLTGMAYEVQPVFSPDGKRFAFVSDRSGSTNLWVANADGTGLAQVSHDTSLTILSSPAWSPDGRFVYVSRMVHPVLAFELWMYDAGGAGEGVRITSAKPAGNEGFDDRQNALGAVASPDGRYLYFAVKTGTTWTERDLPNWQIARRDLTTGEQTTIIDSLGGAMRPALSHDGRRLAYASRWGQQTGLRLRDLESGEDKWIAFPIDHDAQQGGYYSDLLPRIAFAPDDASLVTSVGGRLVRLDLAGNRFADIPFSAHVRLGLGPLTRVAQRDETGPVHVRVVQAPRQSPDGRRVAFSALGTLYVQDLTTGSTPRAIAGAPPWAYQPSWSPDGRGIAFVTWRPREGGAVWTIPAAGGAAKRLTAAPSFFTEPAWSPDGRTVAVLRASSYDRTHAANEISTDRPTDVVTMPAGGGAATLVAHAFGARTLAFDGPGRRLRFYAPEGLTSVRPDGSDLRRELVVQARGWSQYVGVPIAVEDVRLSPDGRQALAKAASQLYLLDVPPANGTAPPTVNLDTPGVHRRKLTRIGADYFDWADGGRTIAWSVGATFRRIAAASAADDAEAGAAKFALDVAVPRDVPAGTVVLRGGTAITMRGDEVIAGADVVVTANRIAAVGRTGDVPIPAGAAIRDVSGKFLIPGFVDTHAHWFEVRRQVFEPNQYDFLANLAFGVTSGLEVQPFTVDIFGYQDMIDAGLMLGPRAFSTGPGVFVNSRIDSRQQAIDVLTRYRDEYRTRNIKSYMIGDRAQRHYMVQAAAALGMMPTTEGASDLRLDITHAIDGFAGNEHALPVTPLHGDVIQLFAQSRTSYTPTLGVVYGGGPAYFDMIQKHRFEDDPKVQAFMPGDIVQSKLRDRHWLPPQAQTYPRLAADALAIQRAGGLVGMGSHGEVQGLGYQWELAAYASGGANPREVLQAATIGSAEVIGRKDDIGSLEPGKYADILVLDADPLADTANIRSIAQVMKNGRIYDAATLDELWPRRRPLERPWFRDAAPPAGIADPGAAR